MMTMPTNKAEDTPMIRGMRSRSATGEGIQRGKLKVFRERRCCDLHFYQLTFYIWDSAISKNNFSKISNAAIFCLQACCFLST